MKKKNDSETTARIKKQLISTGVYIALAAVVVGITANSVKDILGSTKGYEIPEFDNSGEKIVFPQIDGSKDLADNGGKYELPSQKDYSFPDISVSENPSGVNAEITEPVPDDTDSVEPESVSEKNPEEKEETLPKAEPKNK